MKLEDLFPGLSNLTTDELLAKIREVRKSRQERKTPREKKKAEKNPMAELVSLVGTMSEDEREALSKMLGSD